MFFHGFHVLSYLNSSWVHKVSAKYSQAFGLQNYTLKITYKVDQIRVRFLLFIFRSYLQSGGRLFASSERAKRQFDYCTEYFSKQNINMHFHRHEVETI